MKHKMVADFVRYNSLEEVVRINNDNLIACADGINTTIKQVKFVNSKTNLLIFFSAIAAYKICKRIMSLEKKVSELEEKKGEEYWAAEFERMDAKAAEEGEPDVT